MEDGQTVTYDVTLGGVADMAVCPSCLYCMSFATAKEALRLEVPAACASISFTGRLLLQLSLHNEMSLHMIRGKKGCDSAALSRWLHFLALGVCGTAASVVSVSQIEQVIAAVWLQVPAASCN